MSSPGSSVHSKKSKRSKAKEVTSEASAALVTTLTILKESLDGVPVPGLKAAVGGVLEVINTYDKAKGNANDIEELRAHIDRLTVSIIEPLKEAKMTEALETRISVLTKDLQSITEDYEEMAKKGRVRQFLAVHDHANTISGLDRMLNRAIQTFLTGAIIEIERRVVSTDIRTEAIHGIVSRGEATSDAIREGVLRVEGKSEGILEAVTRGGETSEAIHGVVLRMEDKSKAAHQEIKQFIFTQVELDLLNSLPNVGDARYDSASCSTAPSCLQNTREALLADIFDWIKATNMEKKVYWLHGLAGTGKSTVAHTVAQRMAKEGCLGASFFFSKDVQDRRDALLVLPTIAHQLAEFSPEFKKHLVESLSGRRDVAKLALPVQMERLLVNPLRSMNPSSSLLPSSIVVVLDALDECEQQNFVTDLLKLISEFVHGMPSIQFKFFITSRPEHHIVASFRHESAKQVSQPFVLHDIETSIVQGDIEKFVHHKLFDSSKTWPSPDELKELVKRAGALFIVASTIIKFIMDPDVGEPKYQLRELLSDKQTVGDSPYEELDQVYLCVLKASVGRFVDPNHHVCKRFRDVVGAIVTTRDPLSPTSLQLLLGCDVGYINAALDRLRSVIIIPDEPNSSSEPLRVFHLSFPNFLTERCADARFAIDPVFHHSKLALHCLNLLNSFLKRDICELPNPLLLNSEIPDLENRLNNIVLPHHRYACRHWGFHLHAASEATKVLDKNQSSDHRLPVGTNDELLRAFTSFCQNRLLQWIEVLSMLGWLEVAIPMLKAIEIWLKMVDPLNDMLSVIKDSQRLILQFFEPLKMGGSQIYHSALAFMPYCMLYENYKSELGKSVKLVRMRESVWNPCMRTILGHTSGVQAAAFSHDSTLIISGSQDKTACIWDTVTGSLVKKLEGHTDSVNSVAFSYDSTLVVSGSSDKTICIWDAITGSLVKKLEGHKESVNSVAFSHDCTFVVSGSDDDTACIWDVETGSLIKVLEGHTMLVHSVVFSHDSILIASGSYDNTLRIWDTVTGSLLKTMSRTRNSVNSVAFSHDSTLIISGSSDMTVCIWETITGSLVKILEGHSDFVFSVAFSHDSSRILSGSHDHMICIWDTDTGSLVTTLKGHASNVEAVTFSHDSALIVSASYDNTMCIWDASIGPTVKTLEGHTKLVEAVAFSHDGTLVASASYDTTVCLWDTATGSLVRTLEGHTDSVWAVSFSHDSSLLASGSFDNIVCIWDVITGSLIKKLEGHGSPLNSVTFSCDGSYLVAHDILLRSICWSTQNYTVIPTPPSIPLQTQGIPQELTVQGQWVLNASNAQRLCYLPVPFDNIIGFATYRHFIAFGTRSDDVYILNFFQMR